MDYNFKRDGWLKSFVDVQSQSMREDVMPWRGAREKRPEFFSILFSALTDKDNIIMDWQSGVGMFLISLFFILNFSSQLVSFSIFSRFLTFAQLVSLGGSVIACHSIQRHIVALESDIDIYKSVLLPMREPDHNHTSQHVAPQRGSVVAPPPRKMAKRNFDLLCA
jgi:hypothetical protein